MYFWAKTDTDGEPGLSVYEHLLDVGSVALELASRRPYITKSIKIKPSLIAALVALHDVGKISPGFQMKSEHWLVENSCDGLVKNHAWNGKETKHGKVSHSAIQSFLTEIGVDRSSSAYISCIIGAHHGYLERPQERGYFPKGNPASITDCKSGIDWTNERYLTCKKVWDDFIDNFEPHDLCISSESSFLWWLGGLTTVADWIGSDTRFFVGERSSQRFLNERISVSKRALDAIGFICPTIKKDLSFSDLFKDPTNPDICWEPTQMQSAVYNSITDPGVYVVEAPTGGGKTEAALWLSYKFLNEGKASGIYFALPTQTTSNRIHLRLNAFIKNITEDQFNSKLIHASSWLYEREPQIYPSKTLKNEFSEDARISYDWFCSTKKAILYPFGVGTIDQALLGVVACKHFFVRQYALAGKIVILDEVHSYDLYTGTLIDQLIRTLAGLGCTVLVLSATLSQKRLRQIIPSFSSDLYPDKLPYPLISGESSEVDFCPAEIVPSKSRAIKVNFINKERAIELAIHYAEKGGKILYICNTVDEAQKTYLNFKVKTSAVKVGLLHSRYTFLDREKNEIKWMEKLGKDEAKRESCILVSTQVVEQSVDLDADVLISEIAPTDMIIQRVGRLWRHERRNRVVSEPRLFLLNEDASIEKFKTLSALEIKKVMGKKSKVYDPYILLRTLLLWSSKESVALPVQVRELIENTYGDLDDQPQSWTDLQLELEGSEFAKKMKACRSSNLWELALEDEEGTQTRLNELPTIPLVLCKELKDKNTIVLYDDSIVTLNTDRFMLEYAQNISRNTVKVYQHFFNERKNEDIDLSQYIKGKYHLGILSLDTLINSGELKDDVSISYSKELGLMIEQ